MSSVKNNVKERILAMEFSDFRSLMQTHFSNMARDYSVLFTTEVDKLVLWDTYLDSFPPGTNEIFRERREYDCSCCRHFVKSFGNVVAINENNEIVSIWDFETNDSTFDPVVKALSAFVKSGRINDVFVTKEKSFGTDHNFEQLPSGRVKRWDHFYIALPKSLVNTSSKSEGTVMGQYRDVRNVFERSLKEISKDAIETVLDLIAQKSLYKGEEWEGPLKVFLDLHNAYHTLSASGDVYDDEDLNRELEKELRQNNFCWKKSIEVGGSIGKIKNHSIGVLLVDITSGTDLDVAVRKYEAIVAPTNYKRPKAIFTQKMIEQAQKALEDMGLMDSLGRRFAIIGDITINNILFADRDSQRAMGGGVFAELKKEVAVNPKQFSKVEEIPAEQFVQQILPRTTGIEVFLENRHSSDLMSVIAPQEVGSKSLFKWNNGFSWAYQGNITDSMKERVKAAGGNVDGVLRFSLQWNENGDNLNDFDAHCIEPNNNHIWFSNKGRKHPSTGMLDVDIIHPNKEQVAVENITWTDITKMKEGEYVFYVHNYSNRGGQSGFSAEIEYAGQLYTFDYNKTLRQDERVVVAKISFSRRDGIKIIESIPSSASSKQVWGLATNQFHPVSVCMFSPNYWDEQDGIGHRHLFFILRGCKNDSTPNGFFNEFLREDLMDHKRVFEALGSKMRVESSEEQLSGVGFSTTKRNSVICKLKGHVDRIVKVVF
jgi:hypothetical protein